MTREELDRRLAEIIAKMLVEDFRREQQADTESTPEEPHVDPPESEFPTDK